MIVRCAELVKKYLPIFIHSHVSGTEKYIRYQATVSLKVVSRKRRGKCTLKSYDRFTNS